MARRSSHVWAEGRWMPRAEWEALRAQAAGVTIIRDFQDAIVNPADGRAYSTRPAYEAATRAAGCIEIGHTEHRKLRERPREVRLSDPTPDILRAFERGGH